MNLPTETTKIIRNHSRALVPKRQPKDSDDDLEDEAEDSQDDIEAMILEAHNAAVRQCRHLMLKHPEAGPNFLLNLIRTEAK